ncbi:FkbM family methyltransferase [Acidisphaera sp. L21]|uniref:FkbM family methyltransferase n=1 Tax=Acidisphaera sp. L21 TaxID=1641851 RepID=UPI00131D4CC2|nr:FkbM family methyltransferase [Acidisphaera sp. L21]
MPFVSHAQNFEDLMLWRALKHIDRGFYIDVGACEPDADSVTLAFYERGWSGLNIEPAPGAFARLDAARPRDINLNLAAGAEDGEQDFLLVDGGNGLSTLRGDMRETFEAEGRRIDPVRTRVRRLSDLCRDYVRSAIHFLKIDVEGAERDVITGADLAQWRPWIVVVEATVANSPIPTYDQWEWLLLQQRYRMVYADGLNRFYLAEEHEDLAPAFATPPNVFDGYVRQREVAATALATSQAERATALLAETKTLSQRLSTAELRIAETERRLTAAQTELRTNKQATADELAALSAERDHATQEMWESNRLVGILASDRQKLMDELRTKDENHGSFQQLQAVYASTSWRITAPMRVLVRLGRGR